MLQSKIAWVFLLSVAANSPWRAHAELSGNVALTSDYVWRGVSQTDGGPAIQGGVDYSHTSGFYAGIWSSNVDFNEVHENGSPVKHPARIEIDLYAGVRGQLLDHLGWDVSLRRYVFPNTTLQFDYSELSASLSYGIFSVLFQYSNDVFVTGKNGFYYSAGLEYGLPENFLLRANIGYSVFDEAVFGRDHPDNYVDWRLGIAREFAGLEFDLSYYDTNESGKKLNGEPAEGRLVFSMLKNF